MAVVRVDDLKDEVRDFVMEYWKDHPYCNEFIDEDLVFEKIEKYNPLLFDQIKNPQKYIISRWELLDV